MIRNILYELEATLVNIASEHQLDEMEKVRSMQSHVSDAATALQLLENVVPVFCEEQRAHFMAVKNRLLYYIVHFEYEIRQLLALGIPSIEELMPLFPTANYLDWQLAKKSVDCCWRMTAKTEGAFQYHPC
jgi:hypothetical protein